MKILYSLLYSGHSVVDSHSGKRGILLSNAIGLILFGLSMSLFVLYYYWYGWSLVTGAIPIIGLLSLAGIGFNGLGLINTGRFWTCLLIPVIVTALSLASKRAYYHKQEELDYFTFRFFILGSCAFPWILFSLKEKTAMLLCAITSLGILLSFDPLHEAFGVGYIQDKLKAYNYYFSNVVIFITYLLLVGALALLKWISEKNETRNLELIDELNQANQELVEKNSEIEAQRAELLAQSDALYYNQEKLLKANQLIDDQNNRLLNQNQSLSSELVERNTELTETNTELIKHNNELRQFSYTVSHNLRGPVASLLGLFDLIDQHELSENNRELFAHIKTSTQRLDVIITDLSKIIDIRHDIFKIRQRINLDTEINEIVQVLNRDKLHEVTITKNLACTIAYSVKPMVHSILYNLMSNAVKYRSPEREPVIEISSYEEDSYYVIEVKDNGLGIDVNRNRENLFRLYKRFHFHTEGKGIGLYLVKLQAEALGGYVEIESEINRFTCFRIYLRKPVNVERQVLYKEPFAEIFYDARINSTGVIWHGPVSSEQYRMVFQKCLDFVKVYNAPNYISDISHQGPIDKADQLWMFSEIMPEAARNGLTRIAAVRPDAADPKILEYLKGINESLVRLGVWQRFFLTMQEAVDWMENENEKANLKISVRA